MDDREIERRFDELHTLYGQLIARIFDDAAQFAALVQLLKEKDAITDAELTQALAAFEPYATDQREKFETAHRLLRTKAPRTDTTH